MKAWGNAPVSVGKEQRALKERNRSLRELSLRRQNDFAVLRLDESFGIDSWADGPGRGPQPSISAGVRDYYISRRWRFDSEPSLTVGLLPLLLQNRER